jgi:hypothetical protein
MDTRMAILEALALQVHNNTKGCSLGELLIECKNELKRGIRFDKRRCVGASDVQDKPIPTLGITDSRWLSLVVTPKTFFHEAGDYLTSI